MDRLIHWTNSLCGLSFCQIVNGSTMCACVCTVQCAWCLCWYETFWWNWMHTNKPNWTMISPNQKKKMKNPEDWSDALQMYFCVHTAIEMQVWLQKTPLFVSMLYSHFIQCGMMWKFNEHILVCAVQSSLYWELIDTGQTHSHTYESVNEKICFASPGTKSD